MSSTRFATTSFVLAAFVGLSSAPALRGQQPADSGLTPAEFEKLHKELQPPKDELWRTIPWHVSILEGRAAAAKAGKPIFVWVASGEPLGCG